MAANTTTDSTKKVAADTAIEVPLKEDADFEKMSVEQAMRFLECTHDGLSTNEAQIRLQKFGPNKIEETKRNPILAYLAFFWNPLSWCMEIAAIIAIILLDYIDFILIVLLLIINATIGYYEEASADNAIAALTASLAPKAKALRDGKFETIDAAELVPGDVILVRLGDVLPADVKLLGDEHDEPALIDQASLACFLALRSSHLLCRLCMRAV